MNKATHFPVAVADLIKAKRETEFREIRRPSRILWLNPTLADFEKFYTEHIVPAPIVSIDIETNARTITEISFAVSPSLCLVVPFYSHEKVNYWSTISEELAAWSLVRKIFSTKKILGQNFQYDALFSYLSLGIPSPHYTEDTMYLHHTLEPELRKGLGFLASIYTDEPAWKFMRKDATDKLAG